MAGTVSIEGIEDVYKALADRTRLRVLALLVNGEVCVCDIHDALRLPQPTVSRHLAYLRRAGLVAARRQGTWMHYRMTPGHPVVQAIIEGAAHAMTHVPTADRDRHRFAKDRGTVIAMIAAPGAPCCAPRDVAAASGPATDHGTARRP